MSQLEVTIEQGVLRGSTAKDIRGNTFFKFQGIPYAKPPLGELRFKAPVPAEKWTEILDASKEGDVCYAADPLRGFKISGSEDCLVLNVYTRSLPKNETDLRPVLFFIHGGGFVFGFGNEEFYGPHYLLSEDVVLVTINYRLGLLGFLNLEDPTLEVPGNAGMKDQVLALKWVQKNISKFGGNPNNVTIFGESAGGASVHLLTLSPMAKGLFHKAIAQSGCALNPWVISARGTKSLQQALDLQGADDRTIYNTLMQKSKEEILQIQMNLNESFVPNVQRLLSVVIEKDSKEPFLDDEPLNIILSGRFTQVPLMLGYTSSEGMCFEIYKHPELPEEPIFENAVPWFFGYQLGSPEVQLVYDKIKKFYLGDEEFSQKKLSEKYDLLSDCHFIYGIYTTIMSQLKVSKSPIFLYKMTVETNLNFFRKLVNPKVPGVSHCDDLGYLFTHVWSPEVKPGSIEDVSRSRFLKLWTNFAKFGNPTPDKSDKLLNAVWSPVTGPNLDYLEIGQVLAAKTNPDHERINFWKTLFAESPAGQKCGYPHLRLTK